MTIDDLPVAHLAVDPANPRAALDDEAVAELAASIADVGILEPLQVRPAGTDRWHVLAGQTRLAAARLLELDTVPCHVVDPADDDEAFVRAMVSNTGRRKMRPLDEARGYRRLYDAAADRTQADVARLCGVSQARVSQCLQLLTFPDEIQQAVDAGEMGLARAVAQCSPHAKKTTGRGLPRGKAARRAVKLGATTAVHVPCDSVAVLLGVDEDDLEQMIAAGDLDRHPATGGIPLAQVVTAAKVRDRDPSEGLPAGIGHQWRRVPDDAWQIIQSFSSRRGGTPTELLRAFARGLGHNV